MIDDIFNRAGYNNLSKDDKENIAKYPAFEIFMKNSYSMEQLEASHPKEYKILMDIFMESTIKANMCEELLGIHHRFLFNVLLADKEITRLIVKLKQAEFLELERKSNEITSKYLKMGDEFEAGLLKE